MKRKQFFVALTALAALASSNVSRADTIWTDNFDANTLGLNSAPSGWTATAGTVDIIGSNFSGALFDLLPGHGAYIDLDGSTGKAGSLTTLLTLTAGVQYTANFELAGSQRGSTETGKVSFGTASLAYDIASAVGFMGYSLTFTPTTTGQYALSFQNDGGDNIGALLDNVAVADATAPVPEPETYALLGAGLLAVGFVSRRRKSVG